MSGTTVMPDAQVVLDRAAEAKVCRKVIIRLLPFLTLGLIVAYIDRTNVGFAALTMNKDIGLSDAQFGVGAGLLFVGYCVLEIPSNIVLYRVGARTWLARIMISWGILTAATALVVGPNSFYVLRFMLGVAEAGYTPGAMFYLALWVPRQYRGRAAATFMLAAPIASLFSAPLSAAILQQMNGLLGIAGWQWMFILTGLPASILGLAFLFVLSDHPKDARWLTAAERTILTRAVDAEVRERPVHRLGASLKDSRVILLSLIQLGFTIGSYGIVIWLPQILKGHELSTFAIGWLAALPYLLGCVASVVWATVVDRTGKRAFHLVITCLLGAVGLWVLSQFASLEIAMIGVCISVIGVASARGIFWSIPNRFLTGLGAAGGLALINSVGTFGGFIGPSLMGWLKYATGSFTSGLVVLAGLTAASAVFSLVLQRRLPPG